MERVNDTFLLVGRLLLAALFIPPAIIKALGYAGFSQYLGSQGLPYPEAWTGLVIAIEVVGSIALIFGVFPRLTALLLIAFVVVATAIGHRFWEADAAAWQGQLYNFLKNAAILGGLLFYYVSGPGAFALAGRTAGAGVGTPARA